MPMVNIVSRRGKMVTLIKKTVELVDGYNTETEESQTIKAIVLPLTKDDIELLRRTKDHNDVAFERGAIKMYFAPDIVVNPKDIVVIDGRPYEIYQVEKQSVEGIQGYVKAIAFKQEEELSV